MHARSALFDLYGDHLRSRGNQAPVSAVVRLLAPVGIRGPAVRTAISRMVLQGWLEPAALAEGRGYRATEQAIRRLDEAAVRIYRRREARWDGSWQVVLLEPVPDRSRRQRLRDELAWSGYAELASDTWISPWPGTELGALLARAGVQASTATVHDFEPADRPVRAWDLAALGAAYADWLATVDETASLIAQAHPDRDEADFAVRFHLVHEWRKFLFRDPGLPDELLPDAWPGRAAAQRFAERAEALKPGADRFVDRCLGFPASERLRA